MDRGLHRIELTGLAGVVRPAWPRLAGIPGLSGNFSERAETALANTFTRRLVAVPAVLAIGLGAWVLLSGSHTFDEDQVPLAAATTIEPAPMPQSTNGATAPNPAPAEMVPIEAAPVTGLKISSQSWRRGGLGSRALVTVTLRNGNDYAVKDIEIFCSFNRRDGSHLTDRRRMIHEIVNMKSRKTFTRMHVGFVNINANRAKCSLVTASRA